MIRPRLTIAPVVAVFIAAACSETHSPTEPALMIATPTPFVAAGLSGVITDEHGAPRAGLLVACQKGKAWTTPTGFYQLAHLVPGSTGITVLQEGTREVSSFDVVLAAGDNKKDLTVPKYHGQPASMSGVVTIEGRPVAGVRVGLQGKSAASGPDGSYSLAGLESGIWYLSLNSDSTWYEDEVTLVAGANVVDFRLD